MVTLYDVLTVLGIGMVGAGLYFVYPPLALIVPGALFVTLGLLAGRGEALDKARARRQGAREAGRP